LTSFFFSKSLRKNLNLTHNNPTQFDSTKPYIYLSRRNVCFSAYGERKSGTSRRVFWKGGEEREGNIRGRGRGREGGLQGAQRIKE
jgi:hypothetical protein